MKMAKYEIEMLKSSYFDDLMDDFNELYSNQNEEEE